MGCIHRCVVMPPPPRPPPSFACTCVLLDFVHLDVVAGGRASALIKNEPHPLGVRLPIAAVSAAARFNTLLDTPQYLAPRVSKVSISCFGKSVLFIW